MSHARLDLVCYSDAVADIDLWRWHLRGAPWSVRPFSRVTPWGAANYWRAEVPGRFGRAARGALFPIYDRESAELWALGVWTEMLAVEAGEVEVAESDGASVVRRKAVHGSGHPFLVARLCKAQRGTYVRALAPGISA